MERSINVMNLPTGMDFGKAVDAMKHGIPVCREGWNGKGMFIFKQVETDVNKDSIPRMTSIPNAVKDILVKRDLNLIYMNQYAIVYPDNKIYGWVASPSDISSNDWMVFEQ